MFFSPYRIITDNPQLVFDSLFKCITCQTHNENMGFIPIWWLENIVSSSYWIIENVWNWVTGCNQCCRNIQYFINNSFSSGRYWLPFECHGNNWYNHWYDHRWQPKVAWWQLWNLIVMQTNFCRFHIKMNTLEVFSYTEDCQKNVAAQIYNALSSFTILLLI